MARNIKLFQPDIPSAEVYQFGRAFSIRRLFTAYKTQKNRQPYQLPVQSLLYSRNPGDKDLGISVYCKFSASRSHKQRLSFFSSDAFSLTYNICTYHISVLPCWPSLALAYTSSGCTWIERGFLASMSFIRIGKLS